jgi:hypothetical protein
MTMPPNDDVPTFLVELEALGEDEVRFRLHAGAYSNVAEQMQFAKDWLHRKERDRARISNAEAVSAASRAATAAERAAEAAAEQSLSSAELARASAQQARIANDALTIARIAAAVSAIALIVSILGLLCLLW